MKVQSTKGDYLRIKQPIKAELTPCAQFNTQCVVSSVSDSLDTEILTKIEAIKREGSIIYGLTLLLYLNGLRISEALNLKYTDVISRNKAIVRGLKGSEDRIIDISCLSFISDLRYDRNGYLFVDIDRFQVYRLFKKYGIIFRSKGNSRASVTHAFRHLYVRNMRLNSIDESLIQQEIGHKSIKNTNRYGKK